MNNLDTFGHDYLAIWNEPDAVARHKSITELWTADGSYIDPDNEYRGHKQIEAVIGVVYEQFISKGFTFKVAQVSGHHNIVRLYWDLVPVGSDEVIAAGFDFFILTKDGRIRDNCHITDKFPG